MTKEDRSYGVIVVFENKFLLLKQIAGHWGFPKGHLESGESTKEAALRELEEEAGISDCKIYDSVLISEEYTFNDREIPCHKVVEYFIGLVDSDKVITQKEEILDHKWVPYEEALEILTYDNSKETLKKAKEYLDKI